jgi:alpha-ketoglutarate-dependent taurine dioxygenase
MISGGRPAVNSALSETGWSVVPWPESESILTLAETFGQPVPSRRGGELTDYLAPLEREEAKPRSMSVIHGTGPLPLHTDGAYLRIPPRFLLMRLAAGHISDRPTLIVDTHKICWSPEDLRRLRNAVWLVNGGNVKFYTAILNNSLVAGAEIIRFDECCMRAIPSVDDSAETLCRNLRNAAPVEFEWKRGEVLVIDNWRAMHGRGATNEHLANNRMLERVMVKGIDR